VELWGVMPVGWLGNFTRAMSRISVNIVEGSARRGEHARWAAEFEVREATSGESVEQVDFLRLARESNHDVAVPALEVHSFSLGRANGEHGALVLTVRARDRMGFLASLLEHLAGLVLFPEEIRIDTFQNEAHDVLWLSSVGGQSPAPEIEAALRASLAGCTRQRASMRPST
jgi:UTP:GlnB (protein PII) uridylyltransferase